MSERDTLAALLRDEYESGDYWVSKSRLADAAYRGRDPMDDWRGLADRLIAAGVRLAPADTGLRARIEAVLNDHDDGSGYARWGGDALLRGIRTALDDEAPADTGCTCPVEWTGMRAPLRGHRAGCPADTGLREAAQAALLWLYDGTSACECCGMFDDEGHGEGCVVPPLRAALDAEAGR